MHKQTFIDIFSTVFHEGSKKAGSAYAVLAIATLLLTSVIVILTRSPICPPLTNITHPCTLAMPSPWSPICVISTSYSLPTWSCIASVESLLKLGLLILLLLPTSDLLFLLPYSCLFPKLVRGGGGLSFSCPGCDLICDQYSEFVFAFLQLAQFG